MSQIKYHLVEDPEYGFLRIDPTPSVAEVEQYYLNEFYSGEYRQFNDSQLEVQQSQKEFFRLRWQFIHDQCRAMLGLVKGRSLLDIGCGYCQALLYFREQGFSVHGIEPSKEGAEYGAVQGVAVVQAGIESMPSDLGRQFDVVTLLNVLEHLREPARTLVEIRERFLHEGGVLVVDVPNEFNDFQTVANDLHSLGQWWIHPPAHLNYFSPTSLRRLLERCGYRVVHAEASFPLEMFLLWNEVYVGNGELGSRCHERRVAFEVNLARGGKMEKLRKLYAALAELELGRQVTMYAVPATDRR
jgi:2-polyprenyl-3-methyl-5-hydroxy-6-metoxy-1,4-benzoquinol methylase